MDETSERNKKEKNIYSGAKNQFSSQSLDDGGNDISGGKKDKTSFAS